MSNQPDFDSVKVAKWLFQQTELVATHNTIEAFVRLSNTKEQSEYPLEFNLEEAVRRTKEDIEIVEIRPDSAKRVLQLWKLGTTKAVKAKRDFKKGEFVCIIGPNVRTKDEMSHTKKDDIPPVVYHSLVYMQGVPFIWYPSLEEDSLNAASYVADKRSFNGNDYETNLDFYVVYPRFAVDGVNFTVPLPIYAAERDIKKGEYLVCDLGDDFCRDATFLSSNLGALTSDFLEREEKLKAAEKELALYNRERFVRLQSEFRESLEIIHQKWQEEMRKNEENQELIKSLQQAKKQRQTKTSLENQRDEGSARETEPDLAKSLIAALEQVEAKNREFELNAKRFKTLEKELENKASAYNQMKKDLEKKTDRVEKLLEEVEKLKNLEKKTKEEASRLSRKLETKRAKIATFSESLKKMQSREKVQSAKITALTKEKEEFIKELARYRSNNLLAAKDLEIKASRKTISLLQERLSSLSTQSQTAEATDYKQKIHDLTLQRDMLLDIINRRLGPSVST